MLRIFGDPYGNRTQDLALRGPRLNRLTKGPLKLFLYIYIIFLWFRQLFWEIFLKYILHSFSHFAFNLSVFTFYIVLKKEKIAIDIATFPESKHDILK